MANKTSTLTELVDSGALVTKQLQQPKLNGSAKNYDEFGDKNVANKTNALTELVDSGALVTRQLQQPKLNAN